MGMGHDGSKDYTDLWAYDPDSSSWTQKKDFPGTGRMQSYVFVINGKAIIGGGHRFNSSSSNAEDDYYRYDPSNDTWDTLTANFTDSNRTLAAAFTLNNKGYLYGGRASSGNNFNDLQEYSPALTTALIERKKEDKKLLLYPIPNKGRFTLQLNETISSTSQFTVYNEMGKLIYSQTISPNNQKHNINIEGLSQGIYIYNLVNSKQSLSGLIPVINP